MITSSSPPILIIKHGGFGDFIQCLGGLKAIRAHHPGALITLLTIPSLAGLARQCPYVDTVEIDARPKGVPLRHYWRMAKIFRRGWGRVYDLQNSDRTAFYFRLLTPRPRPEWSGFQQGASLQDTQPLRTKNHTLERVENQLQQAGIATVPPPSLDWLIPQSSLSLPAAPYALLVPGSAPHRPEKRWPARYYATLAQHLVQKSIIPVLLGTKDDADATATIAAAVPEALNLNGKTTIADIARLASHAHIAIGNDTGTMHVAAVTGCPSIVLFSGASNPARCAPKGGQVTIIQRPLLAELPPKEVIAFFLDGN
ncbi:MAG: glycosyltransferase family 9 protein [Holosporales bacterium]